MKTLQVNDSSRPGRGVWAAKSEGPGSWREDPPSLSLPKAPGHLLGEAPLHPRVTEAPCLQLSPRQLR